MNHHRNVLYKLFRHSAVPCSSKHTQRYTASIQSPAKFHIRILRASNWNVSSHAFFISFFLSTWNETAGDLSEYRMFRCFIMRHVNDERVCVCLENMEKTASRRAHRLAPETNRYNTSSCLLLMSSDNKQS